MFAACNYLKSTGLLVDVVANRCANAACRSQAADGVLHSQRTYLAAIARAASVLAVAMCSGFSSSIWPYLFLQCDSTHALTHLPTQRRHHGTADQAQMKQMFASL